MRPCLPVRHPAHPRVTTRSPRRGQPRPNATRRPCLGRPLPAAGRLRGPGPAAVPSRGLAAAEVLSAGRGTAATPLPLLPHTGGAGAGRSGRRKLRTRWRGRRGGKPGGGGPVRRLSLSEIFQPYLTRKYGSPGEKKD